jgi:predicted amidophosphoribosyltransferase
MQERRQNVDGAFLWNGPPLHGETVLLIDDVATTGSTLDACGAALSQAGAGSLWALTAARAVARPDNRLPDGPIP